MAMISGSLLEVACIYLSRVPSFLRTLAIAEYGMFDSIEGTVKEGNRSIVLGSIWEPEHAVIVSLVDGFGPIKGPNDCGIGSSVVLALRPTTLTCTVKGGSSLRRIITPSSSQ